jgi:hypothetical protein
MKKELDDQLCKDFPKLLRDRNKGPYETCMYRGFDVGDGWHDLVRECCAKLEAINNTIEDPTKHIVASQVKEKFGTLRFYIDTCESAEPRWKEIQEAIDVAEAKSEVTCEVCGKPGKLIAGRWWKTFCEEHAKPKETNEKGSQNQT